MSRIKELIDSGIDLSPLGYALLYVYGSVNNNLTLSEASLLVDKFKRRELTSGEDLLKLDPKFGKIIGYIMEYDLSRKYGFCEGDFYSIYHSYRGRDLFISICPKTGPYFVGIDKLSMVSIKIKDYSNKLGRIWILDEIVSYLRRVYLCSKDEFYVGIYIHPIRIGESVKDRSCETLSTPISDGRGYKVFRYGDPELFFDINDYINFRNKDSMGLDIKLTFSLVFAKGLDKNVYNIGPSVRCRSINLLNRPGSLSIDRALPEIEYLKNCESIEYDITLM